MVTRFSGLILEINIEQHEYIGQLTQEAGMRVLISKQGEFPSPLEKGFSISPGYSTSVGMRQVFNYLINIENIQGKLKSHFHPISFARAENTSFSY